MKNLIKHCTKCGQKKSIGEFYKCKKNKDGLHVWCKTCCGIYGKKYWRTLIRHLRGIFYHIEYRCNNPKNISYKNYGGRGIKCKFTTIEFIDYITNDLHITDINQIQDLQIDRIDNDGHYEKGNIRFVTAKENCNNRKRRQG